MAGKPDNKTKNPSNLAPGNGSNGNHITHEQIASLACKIYMDSGCKQGRDAENWLQAEEILRQQAQQRR